MSYNISVETFVLSPVVSVKKNHKPLNMHILPGFRNKKVFKLNSIKETFLNTLLGGDGEVCIKRKRQFLGGLQSRTGSRVHSLREFTMMKS